MSREYFPFRKRDHLTGKWYRARWTAPLEEIERNGWVVDGPPEIRGDPEGTGYFHPYPSAGRPNCGNVVRDPPLTPDEKYLVLFFLRRYVTYCARRRRFAQMLGAGQLYMAVAS